MSNFEPSTISYKVTPSDFLTMVKEVVDHKTLSFFHNLGYDDQNYETLMMLFYSSVDVVDMSAVLYAEDNTVKLQEVVDVFSGSINIAIGIEEDKPYNKRSKEIRDLEDGFFKVIDNIISQMMTAYTISNVCLVGNFNIIITDKGELDFTFSNIEKYFSKEDVESRIGNDHETTSGEIFGVHFIYTGSTSYALVRDNYGITTESGFYSIKSCRESLVEDIILEAIILKQLSFRD